MFATILSRAIRLSSKAFGLLLLLALTSAVAYAQTASTGTKTGGGGAVPEIDPAQAASALTLLCGGVLVLADKIRLK